jgi:uncharacterized protein YlbG (UPF0298 family)
MNKMIVIQLNSVQFFIIYVPSQQLQGQLHTQHSVGTGNCIKDRHNIKTIATYNNNSIKFFIIYVPSQQREGQLQTQHSVDTGNYIKDTHTIKTTATYYNNNNNNLVH